MHTFLLYHPFSPFSFFLRSLISNSWLSLSLLLICILLWLRQTMSLAFIWSLACNVGLLSNIWFKFILSLSWFSNIQGELTLCGSFMLHFIVLSSITKKGRLKYLGPRLRVLVINEYLWLIILQWWSIHKFTF